MMAPTRVQLYHFVPKCKDNLYINIKSKISLYFGTDWYITVRAGPAKKRIKVENWKH